MSNQNHHSYTDRPRKRPRSRSKRDREQSDETPPISSRPAAAFPLPMDAAPIGEAQDTESAPPVVVAAENPTPRRPLLDAAAARRLAADARAREQASREALEAARRALAESPEEVSGEASDVLVEPLPEAVPIPETPEGGWQRRALVAREPAPTPPTLSPTLSRTLSPTLSSTLSPTPSPGSTPSESEPRAGHHAIDADFVAGLQRDLAAAQAESREFQATLSIARDTTRGQRQLIAELRGQLADRPSPIVDAGAEADALRDARRARAEVELELTAARSELDRLREHITRQDREAAEREAERVLLRQTSDEREALLSARNSQLDALRDRFEAQDRALDGARREYELERARHSRSLEILNRLRSTLASSEVAFDSLPAPSASSEPVADEVVTPAVPASELAPVETGPGPQTEQVASLDPDAQGTPLAAGPTAPTAPIALPSPDAPNRGALFDAWQDDQIRRQFGPMGIDSFVDLLRAPLARRPDTGARPQRILLLGREAWGFAARLTEGLVQNGNAAFTIHVADAEGALGASGSAIPLDSPVRDYLFPTEMPTDADGLEALLESVEPAAIVSRNFLSHVSDLHPWLACLHASTQRGTCLLFSERTGTELGAPSPDMVAIGERIWELMPDRYTRIGESDERISSWREGFERCERPPANQLVDAIRAGFEVEIMTQFGFLAEPFLGSAISRNFDARAPRDRRFLHQVSDLDDRKIEAGMAPALHLVALVDPLSEAGEGH